jgi:hypothetical protein
MEVDEQRAVRDGVARWPRAQESPALRKGSETAASARGSPSCAGNDVDVTSGLRMESGLAACGAGAGRGIDRF